MAADPYGLDNLSLLTSPQQETARNINDAFKASAAARDRNLARYSMAAPSAPMMDEMENQMAIQRAKYTSGILNQNQQIQNLIDASHATPHGIGQNLAAYLPMLGAGLNMVPALFGYGAGSDLAKKGIVGTLQDAGNKVVSWFKNPIDGRDYPIGADGKVLDLQATDYGTPYGESSYATSGWNPGAVDFGSDVATTVPYIDTTVNAIPDITDFGSYVGTF